MIHLYMTRHGQTLWNSQWRIQGQKNSPLTVQGIEDAETLARRLSCIDLDLCYTSPMPRAIHTAHILIGRRNIPLIVEPSIAEMDLGRLEGIKAADFEATDPESFDAFRNHPDRFIPQGGESFQDVVSRAKAFLSRVASQSPSDAQILGVTHCILLQAMTMLCENRPLSSMRSAHFVKQTTIFHFVYENGAWQILSMNSDKPESEVDLIHSSSDEKSHNQGHTDRRDHQQRENNRYNF